MFSLPPSLSLYILHNCLPFTQIILYSPSFPPSFLCVSSIIVFILPKWNHTQMELFRPCIQHSPVGIPINLPRSFEWLSGILLMECTLQPTPADGHFRDVQPFALTDIPVTNISGHISLHT